VSAELSRLMLAIHWVAIISTSAFPGSIWPVKLPGKATVPKYNPAQFVSRRLQRVLSQWFQKCQWVPVQTPANGYCPGHPNWFV